MYGYARQQREREEEEREREAIPSSRFDKTLTINQIIDDYCADCENPHSERGRRKTAGSIRLHFLAIRKAWGHLTIAQFSDGSKNRVKKEIERWRAGPPPLAQGTCRKRMSQFKAALNLAYNEERIEKVPPFKLPKSGPPRERVLTDAEIKALLEACDHPATPPHTRNCFHLSLRTGQRQGAIAALKWEHVDFETNTIWFRNTEAASERSQKRRTDMPMSESLREILLEARAQATTEWVLEFRCKRAANTTHSMRKLYERAGITDAHRHDIRRTAATLAFRAGGGDMKMAANFLGDTEAIAARHYAKSRAEDRLTPVLAIDDFIKKAQGVT